MQFIGEFCLHTSLFTCLSTWLKCSGNFSNQIFAFCEISTASQDLMQSREFCFIQGKILGLASGYQPAVACFSTRHVAHNGRLFRLLKIRVTRLVFVKLCKMGMHIFLYRCHIRVLPDKEMNRRANKQKYYIIG